MEGKFKKKKKIKQITIYQNKHPPNISSSPSITRLQERGEHLQFDIQTKGKETKAEWGMSTQRRRLYIDPITFSWKSLPTHNFKNPLQLPH